MRGTSSEFDDIVRSDHTSSCQVDIIKGGQALGQVEPTGGVGVTADRTAAQLRTLEFEIPIPDVPITVYGTRLQAWGGVVKPATGLHEQVNTALTGWGVTNGGVLNGLMDDGSGALVVGP